MDTNQPAIAVTPRRSVRTLDQAAFDVACASLLRLAAVEYRPTLLVGIRTGGLAVAEAMSRSSPTPLPVLPLTCRRASTHTKSRVPFLHHVLGTLPRGAVDALRVMEHRLLSAHRKRNASVQHIDHAEARAVGEHVVAMQQRRLLVVDDAVDSGVTLATVLGLLREVCPAATEIRSAVITVTLEGPRIEPDYALYRGELCRFPWSFDAAR